MGAVTQAAGWPGRPLLLESVLEAHESVLTPGPTMLRQPRREWFRFTIVFTALALFFGWYATIEFRRYPKAAPSAWRFTSC